MIISGIPANTLASESVHLLGFVEQLCQHETYCLELQVEKDYVAVVGRRITVRYEAVTTIFDPENYELSLSRSNIIPGSHLRLLLKPDPQGRQRDYIAEFIWIGD
ncbi:MAG: hypothetical protein ACYST9_05215 [Planctomycetota bacterium]